ncbi:MAG: lysophospholipase [Clostridia bacterium]|nr:lysophospholipase [Clostridia bacterium]
MSFEIKELAVHSTDNIHTLIGKIYIPDGEIKGLFHIVHGMTEHIERYDHIMSALADAGYVAFGYDNLGHGKTAKDDSELGFIAHSDGWVYLINDVFTFGNTVKKLYPEKPLYLFGHSMGSFIARLAAENYGDNYKKLIICGTGGYNPLAPFGLFVTDILRFFRGEKYISKLVINMAFGAYNKKFEHISDYDWLTKNRDVIEKYSKDKFCTFKFTVSAMHDLVKLNSMCNRKSWYENLRKDMPVLLISGDSDPVGNYGKGVKDVYKKLKSVSVPTDLKLYENCRHEILNDTCQKQVIADILSFID